MDTRNQRETKKLTLFISCLGIILFFMFLSVHGVYAEGSEFVAEGTYIMTNKDTPEKAEDMALFVAEKKALEQASVYVLNAKLNEEQLRALVSKVMNINIQEQKKGFIGSDIIFWVKIKADIDANKIEEAIESVQREFPEKKKMAAILYVNMQSPKKNDLGGILGSDYTLDNYIQDNRIIDAMRGIISEKYSSKNITLDLGDKINNDFFAYMKAMNMQIKNSDLSVIKQEYMEEFAKHNQYDYILIVSPNFTNIEKVSDYLIVGWCFRVKLDMDCDIKIYDTKATKIIYANKLSEKAKAESSAMYVNSAMWPQTLTLATNKMLNNIKERITKEVPNIPIN